MVFEVLGHLFASVEACLELGVCDVASHDDGAFQVDARGDGILGEFCTDGVDALVEVDDDGVLSLAGLCKFSWDEFCGVGVHLLEPHAVGIDFGFDVAVGRA